MEILLAIVLMIYFKCLIITRKSSLCEWWKWFRHFNL